MQYLVVFDELRGERLLELLIEANCDTLLEMLQQHAAEACNQNGAQSSNLAMQEQSTD